ncbi:hypothetical protein [Orrella marina]|uniref:Uncharacterized protein n=1 Tax=Orrella marina TaxID=2163011 RepID=A0A2R4XJF5_9BURK|nr:hypothetical protein [Orrella marina]AWB33898.1 hypothetical protein DBV39_09470 [Orrella marina]
MEFQPHDERWIQPVRPFNFLDDDSRRSFPEVSYLLDKNSPIRIAEGRFKVVSTIFRTSTDLEALSELKIRDLCTLTGFVFGSVFDPEFQPSIAGAGLIVYDDSGICYRVLQAAPRPGYTDYFEPYCPPLDSPDIRLSGKPIRELIESMKLAKPAPPTMGGVSPIDESASPIAENAQPQKESDALKGQLNAQDGEGRLEARPLVGSGLAFRYETDLLQLVAKVQERYLGDNFDPSDPDTRPPQAHVIEWLRESDPTLSEADAKAVDRIAMPFKRGK